jgi:hypothetical protein
LQSALVEELKLSLPDADIRPEYPIEKNKIDIIVRKDGLSYPIELKYKTKKILFSDKGESFNLTDQDAQNIGCYKYVEDISRLESLAFQLEGFKRGYAICLTNDMSYLREPRSEDVGYAEFSVHEGAKKSGTMKWGDNIDKDAIKKAGCGDSLHLKGKYEIRWRDFSKLDDTNAGTFKYALVGIGGK